MSALIPINNINVNFEVVNDEVFATSLQIAEVFEKNHKNILRIIEKLPQDDFSKANFKIQKRTDLFGAATRSERYYNLTRDGFSLLVMGFTGERAYQWKIEFIKAFNMMEAELRRQGVIRYVDKISELEAFNILQAKKHKRELAGKEGRITHLKNRLKTYEFKAEPASEIEKLEAGVKYYKNLASQYEQSKEFYRRKNEQTQNDVSRTGRISIRALDLIRAQLEDVYTAAGALMAFLNDGDEVFMKKNKILGDVR
jgi:phage regulatory protein, rha family